MVASQSVLWTVWEAGGRTQRRRHEELQKLHEDFSWPLSRAGRTCGTQTSENGYFHKKSPGAWTPSCHDSQKHGQWRFLSQPFIQRPCSANYHQLSCSRDVWSNRSGLYWRNDSGDCFGDSSGCTIGSDSVFVKHTTTSWFSFSSATLVSSSPASISDFTVNCGKEKFLRPDLLDLGGIVREV